MSRAARRRLLVTAVVLAAAVGASCGDDDDGAATVQPSTVASDGPSSPPADRVTIRMGWGVPAEEIKYVMMQRPELAANLGTWYDIEWHQFAGTPPGVQGLAADTLDCATVGGLSVANGLEKGADIVLLGELIEERSDAMSTTWMASKASGIDSVDDLKGKTVATPAVGASTDYIQNDYIEQQTGLVAGEDYENVEVPFAQMQETLLAGHVDVGVFPQPFFAVAMATGEVTPLFRLTDEIDPFVQLLNGCRRDFVEQRRDAIEKFQQDWFAIADWLADPANRAAAVAASTSTTGMPGDVLAGYLLGPDDYVRPAHGVINRQALQAEWDFFHRRGALQTQLQVDDHVIPELLVP